MGIQCLLENTKYHFLFFSEGQIKGALTWDMAKYPYSYSPLSEPVLAHLMPLHITTPLLCMYQYVSPYAYDWL